MVLQQHRVCDLQNVSSRLVNFTEHCTKNLAISFGCVVMVRFSGIYFRVTEHTHVP